MILTRKPAHKRITSPYIFSLAYLTITQLDGPTSPAPFQPGFCARSLEHQRTTGVIYEEEHAEALCNDPVDHPTMEEHVAWLHKALLDEADNEVNWPDWREKYWERVARGEFLGGRGYDGDDDDNKETRSGEEETELEQSEEDSENDEGKNEDNGKREDRKPKGKKLDETMA